MFKKINSVIKKYLLAGILATLPLFLAGFITYKVFIYILSMSSIIIPSRYLTVTSEVYILNFLFHYLAQIISILITLTALIFIGILTVNYIGTFILNSIERVIDKIPIARVVYSTTKQISSLLFSSEAPYKKVVLLEYPRKGIHSMGFLTNTNLDIIEDGRVSVFVPTSPNPTSGMMVICKKEDLTELNMSVEVAAKLIISAGALKS